MNGVVSDLRSKFENNLMYVINQKSQSLYPNNLPNGPMYFPDSQMHTGIHMHGEQLPFSTCMPTMMNNHNSMQSNMTRFINPQNGNSIRQQSIMTSSMMPQGNKNHKSTLNNCAITDDISMSYQTAENFPSMNNTPYKSRNPSLDCAQSIVNTQNSTNLVTDLINTGNIPADPGMPVHAASTNRAQNPRNKRTRTATSRSQTPNVKESINGQTVMAPSHANTVIRPASANVNTIPNVSPGIPHHKCLPPTPLSGNIPMPYNMVDMVPQQMRPRIPVNVINSYGCNRPPMMDKNMSMFPPGPHSSPVFNPSPHNVPPFFTQVDNGLPLPMFHLHSRLSKLPDCDRLTFPVNHGNLWGPLTLRHGDQVTEVQFELNQDNLQQIVNRSDLDIIVTSFTHRDQFRLCHWPEFLELKINGNTLSLDSTLLQDLKVHMPSCIKRFCRLGTNVLQFTVSKCVCCHLFQTYMVHRPTLSHAMETIQSKCTSSIATKTLLSEIYSRNLLASANNDDVNNICIISLICPMSQTKITVPARTKCCKHVQPFDLLEFLRVQTKWPQYFCPICRVRVTFNLNEYIQNIVVDEIIKDIINQSDPSVRRVILYPDGKWKPLNDTKSGCTVPIVPQLFQDAYDHDSSSLHTTIRQSPVSSRSAISSPQSVMQHKSNICNDNSAAAAAATTVTFDKRTNPNHQHTEPDFYNPGIISPKINNLVCSSTMLSPVLSRNPYGNNNNMSIVEPHSRSDTPQLSTSTEPSPQKRSKKSPSQQHYSDSFANLSLPKFSNLSTDSLKKSGQSIELGNVNSPESIKTPLSSTSVPAIQISYQASSMTIVTSNNASLINTVSSSSLIDSQGSVNLDTDINLISSTTNLRSSAPVNVDNVNKQTSSGSSNPSSPPEFFDPHSATTNYEDDENSSLHLQRLIGFIDEILSEEEEYVLDTQWASFTWPSADKSLDLLHLSDIEKLL